MLAAGTAEFQHPHIHVQAQTLPTGVADIATIDGPQMLKTLHTYPLLFRGVSLIRGGVETWPTAVDLDEATSSARSPEVSPGPSPQGG